MSNIPSVHDMVLFVGALASNWAAFMTGGIPAASVLLIERWRTKQFEWKTFAMIFLVFGFLAASYETWNGEYVLRKNAEDRAFIPKLRDRTFVLEGLKSFYTEADNLFMEGMALKPNTSDQDYKRYSNKVEDFSRRMERWIIENMGMPARARILQFSIPLNLTFKNAINADHNSTLAVLMNIKVNIDALIQSPAWDKP